MSQLKKQTKMIFVYPFLLHFIFLRPTVLPYRSFWFLNFVFICHSFYCSLKLPRSNFNKNACYHTHKSEVYGLISA